jgi:hypothetical protein
MSVALLDRRRQRPLDGALWEECRIWNEEVRPGASSKQVGRLEVEGDGALTLDELIAGIWEELGVQEMVSCPACHGRMMARAVVGGDVQGGDCLDCGAQLS